MSDRRSVKCNSCKKEMVPSEHTNVYGWVTGHTCPLCGALWYIDAEARKNFEVREESFVEQGKIWLQKKQYIGARAEFQAALTLNENNIVALFGLGEALYGLNELDEAKEVFERIIASKVPVNDQQMYKDIGMIACRAKHFDLAHKALDRAVKIFPSDSKVFYCKAVAFVAAGDFEGSLPYLEKSLQLEPAFAEARALEHKVMQWLKGAEKKTTDGVVVT